MQSADLTLRLPEWMQLPIPEVGDEPEVHREEVLSWRIDPDAELISFLTLIVGDLDAVRTVGSKLDAVRRFDLTPVDDETFYGYAEMDLREADVSLLGTFDERGLVLVPPIVYTDRETVHVTVLGESDALSGLLDEIPDGVVVDVNRVGEHRHLSGSLAGRLTARQFEALETARSLGYYDVPRTASLATVADELDCSESAASTLLRNAESELVDAALGN